MTRKSLCLALVLGLVSSPMPLPAQTPTPTMDPDIVRGIAQVDDGDYDAAILTLDNAARRLGHDPNRTRDLSQAYLYLGIAYLGKGHEAAARAKFREALAQIKDLTLSPEKFPPKVIDAFEAAKEEAEKNAPAAATAPTKTAGAPTTPEKKKGGSGKIILIVGGLAAAGGIAAVAGGGGGSKTAAPTTTTLPPDTRTVDTFPGALCCNDYPDNYHQQDVVVNAPGTLDATITWTNTNPNLYFSLELLDDNYTTVSRSVRGTLNSQLSASVSPRTSSSNAAYHMDIVLNSADPVGSVDYVLTIKHP